METIIYIILTFGSICLVLFMFFKAVLPPHDKDCICHKHNSKLSLGVTIKNMDTKPYNPNCRIGNYEPPKPVGRPNTTSSIKNFKR